MPVPRWLVTLLVLLLLFGFVLPDPVRAGNTTGDAVDSVVIFFRSLANAVGGTVSTPGGSAYRGDGTGDGGERVYPTGGVASGDGTRATGSGGILAFGLPSTPARAFDATLASEATLRRSRPVQLSIPSIGVETKRFVGLGRNPDGSLEIPQAADVVGWYRAAATPGERGPAVATAHVDWRHERGVFAGLRHLTPGSGVTVERADGVAAEFQVTRVEEYLKERFPTTEVYGSTDGAELRLITCGGRYDQHTRDYEANIVAFARMVGVSHRGDG